MSKTFKETDPDRTLKVFRHGAKEGAWLQMHRAGDWNTHTFTIAPSDAPAVCLAILEAAGVEPLFDADAEFGTAEQLGHIQDHLHEYVKAQEATAAAEADRVKLEQEALKLAQAGCEAVGDDSAETLDEMTVKDQKFFLAVARAARELNKETGQ